MKSRESLGRILYEAFNFPVVCLKTSQVLALYGLGKSTGIVLDIGETHTVVVPIFDGCIISDTVNKSANISGNAINHELARLLKKLKGITFDTFSDKQILEDIKKEFCYVAQAVNEAVKVVNTRYELKGDKPLVLGKERIRCTEILFDPKGKNKGVQEMLIDSIKKCDKDFQKKLWQNICVIGGSSLFQGLEKRLLKELKLLVPEENIRILKVEDKITASWKGSALFAKSSLTSETYDEWVTNEQYNEYGPGAFTTQLPDVVL